MKKRLLPLLALLLAFSGCQVNGGAPVNGESVSQTPVDGPASQPETSGDEIRGSEADLPVTLVPEQTPSASVSVQEDPADESELLHPYIQSLLEDIAAEIATPEMGEYERAKAAFDYMLTHTVIGEPIGQELWRTHGGGEEPIPFLQQRALSPLRFGVGMCEDYAAALTLLLRQLGLKAAYVPGLTYSVEGHLVDHVWTMVQIDGIWYHLDSQLEDNITRHGTVRYRYFLKGDETLSGSHLWGQRLLDAGVFTEEQAAEVRSCFLAPECPEDYPAPPRLQFEETPAPDLSALRQEAEAEIEAWEDENGPLPPMELNTTPPVFGTAGYGPADEG